jgi:hypothetical protein
MLSFGGSDNTQQFALQLYFISTLANYQIITLIFLSFRYQFNFRCD